MSVLSPQQRHFLLYCGAGPELLLVVQAVARQLPALGLRPADLVEFVCAQTGRLNTEIWQAFRALAGPDAHPLDGYPAVIGPVRREMTLGEVEAVIADQPEEHVVIFDGYDGLQVARFGPAGTRAAGVDPRGKTLLDPLLKVRRAGAQSWVLTHNHPLCGVLSHLDLMLARRLDLLEIRAVCATGARWSCTRPAVGWPSEAEMLTLCEEAERIAMPMTEEAFDEKMSMRRRFGGLEESWAAFFSSYFTAAFNQRAQHWGFDDLAIKLQPAAARRGAAHRRSRLAATSGMDGR